MSVAEKVLVIDDEPQVLIALEDLLSERYVVFKSGRPEQALELLESVDDIAVILTDQRMPGMLGAELLSRLPEGTDAQRILVTGYSDLSAVVSAINEGHVFAYVTKPWETADLQVKVDAAAERFRLTRQLAHERQLLHDLMDNSPDGIAFRDADGRFQQVNRAYAELLGAPSSEFLLGKTLGEILANRRGGGGWCQEDALVLSQGQPLVDTIREYRTGVSVSETIAPIRGPARKAQGLVSIARNVTPRLQMEEELRASEQRFRQQSTLLHSILQSMEDGVVVADAQGNLLYFNRKAETMFGHAPGEHTLENWAEAFGLYAKDGTTPLTKEHDPLSRAIAGEASPASELVLKAPQQADTLLAVRANPLSGKVGAPAGAVGLLRDVTTQRQLEQQLHQSQRLDALGQLAGGIAHDFGNVLAVIENYTHLIKHALEQDAPAQADLDEVLAAVRQAVSLTRQLLVFGRPRGTQAEPTALNETVLRMEKMLRRVLPARISLVTTLDAGPTVARIEESQLEQVIMNLALNARDAMPNGGKLKIMTRTRSTAPGAEGAKNWVDLIVSDTGTGMSEEVTRRIFEPFFTTKQPGKGTGLGLATVYGIVRQCGGLLKVDSSVGRGTTFRMELPACVEQQVRPSAPREPSEPPAPGCVVLLIEEDRALRTTIERLLAHAGYAVLVAENETQARALCEERRPIVELVLTSSAVPDGMGQSLVNSLAQANPQLCVLYMADASAAAELNAPGGRTRIQVLDKPVSPRELTLKISEILASR